VGSPRFSGTRKRIRLRVRWTTWARERVTESP
jgi:hypothetical protein